MTGTTGEMPMPQAGTAGRAYYKMIIEVRVETVCNTLIKKDEALPFFFGAVCWTPNRLAPGEPMAMQSGNGKYTSVVGKVLEFDPPHRYSHTVLRQCLCHRVEVVI